MGFLSMISNYLLAPLIKTLILILPVLISVAFITLAERKVLSLTGSRQGPNKVSVQGMLQPIADAMKLANKSINLLSNFSFFMYYLSVMTMFTMSLLLWSCFMSHSPVLNWKFSFLVLMIVLGISSMKAILAGWSTYSKYSLIGSMRTVSQMISYESVIYLILLIMIWLLKDFSMPAIKTQEMIFIVVLIPVVAYFWIPSILAELNRTPYDFSEGESELVSGFNTEFGSKSFTLIFLSEYSSIIFFMTLTTTLMLYQNLTILALALVAFLNFWVIWIRSTLPRMRFDKFMSKAWKFYIPFMTMILLIMMFFN